MPSTSLSLLADHLLLHALRSLVARDRATTAELLAHLAEVDERKLYLPAACASMFVYCVRELGMSEDEAFKRIQAARAARRYPEILAAVSEGRVHLSGIVLLAPHLSRGNVRELLSAATGKTRAEILVLLAERFPRPDVPTSIREVRGAQLVSKPVHANANACETGLIENGAQDSSASGRVAHTDVLKNSPLSDKLSHFELVSKPVAMPAAALAPTQQPRPRVTPLTPERYALQVTVSRETREKLRHAQALLGHAVATGDVAQVLDRALDALIERLEKRKFAKTSRPRAIQGSASARHVPAGIRREVWQRDGGRCTFVSDAGTRCQECSRLEYDHVLPVARGGQTTPQNLRLRCRAHNQYAAEQVLGAGFMRRKREKSAGSALSGGRRTAARTTWDRAETSSLSPPSAP